MSNNGDEESDVGSMERETLQQQSLKREARLAAENENPVDPVFQGRNVQFELPEGLRAAARNRAPAGSVASVGSVAVFGRANRRTLDEIVLDEILVRKDDRGTPGSKIFVTNRAAATLGLTTKFLGSIHLLSKNAAGENMQKAKNIQDQFVSNLDVMGKLVERIKQYDMLLPLQIPKVYHDVVNVEDRWDMNNNDREIVDLSTHWVSCRWSTAAAGSVISTDTAPMSII